MQSGFCMGAKSFSVNGWSILNPYLLNLKKITSSLRNRGKLC